MGTSSDKLQYLTETKNLIAQAISEQGVTIESSDTFRAYTDKIAQIPSTSKIGVAKVTLDWETRNDALPEIFTKDHPQAFYALDVGCNRIWLDLDKFTKIAEVEETGRITFRCEFYVPKNSMILIELPYMGNSRQVSTGDFHIKKFTGVVGFEELMYNYGESFYSMLWDFSDEVYIFITE